MTGITADRRDFLRGSGALAATLSLKYAAPAGAEDEAEQVYGRWEDLMRQKWTWDSVVRGSRGLNCTGHCAFNVYVKNGIVWREEQQGEYGRSGTDTPDYGPRGCQKGLRHSKYMYGRQRVLYPMKRAGERGEGKWERISWDQACTEIADKFIDYAVEHGPESITFAMGTQMILKRASFASLFRFANLTGISVPETFAGVGDLPVGAYQVLGYELPGDNMAAVFKSRVCLIWFCNPAATRIPDAHFFWEARYNGTEVIAISPDFNGSAMHASKWLNPKPGTDGALAMAMVNVLVDDGSVEWDYVREQTDLPFLVRADNRKFLRRTDLDPGAEDGDTDFYFWDENTDQPVQAPGTGFGEMAFGPDPRRNESLALGDIRPAVEGNWIIETPSGPVEVTTVFELLKQQLKGFTPERAAEITGVHADNIRSVARTFASAKPGMIFAGYRVNKWLHGDLILRAWLLMSALTGNTGRAGGGVQTTQLANADGFMAFVMNGVGPRLRVAAVSLWDYAHVDGAQMNRDVYGENYAAHVDGHYQAAVQNGWIPNYAAVPWKMGIMAGHNPANWRATGRDWKESAFMKLDTTVTLTPNMSVTAILSDYVLPIADHYERQDYIMEGRTPYAQVIDKAVAPLGESLEEWSVLDKLSRAISQRAAERGIEPIKGEAFGQPVEWDYSQLGTLFTTLQGQDGKTLQVKSNRDVVDFILANSSGMSDVTFDKLQLKGIVRVDDADDVQFGPNAPYSYYVLDSVKNRIPYATLTGRQQFYMDHDWFLQEGEGLPGYRAPLKNKNYDLRLVMGHARHGIHSMYRDDSLLVSLQRGEPDVHVNPDDAVSRGVADGDLVKVYNDFGSFVAQARVSSNTQPGTMFMYHGWDPMMFRGRDNFSSVISTRGLIKPVQMISGYGHINYTTPNNVPNQTFHDTTCEFEKYVEA
ncbi:MAG: molybdopterin-dependent oxidoreductase [Gammaproteobacteria bacterium]|nr:molybdopterin-dependent oxidoreductase [Gammaproteobacteria bacterium]